MGKRSEGGEGRDQRLPKERIATLQANRNRFARAVATNLPETQRLDTHRLFRAHRDWCQPVIAIFLLAANDAVKLRLQGLGQRTDFARAHSDFVDRADRRDFSSGSGEEDLVSDVERFAGNLLLGDLDAKVARDR